MEHPAIEIDTGPIFLAELSKSVSFLIDSTPVGKHGVIGDTKLPTLMLSTVSYSKFRYAKSVTGSIALPNGL